MPFENFPETPGQPEQTAPQKKNNMRNYLTGGLIVALLGTWGYIIWDKNQTKETIQQKDAVIVNKTTQADQLQKELEEATMRYDMIKTSSANMVHSKDSVITQRDKNIAQKKKAIQDLLVKAKDNKALYAEAETLITDLKNDIEGYKTNIEKLEGEKLVLTQQKEAITQERDRVNLNLDSANKELKQKDAMINVASTLHASNFLVAGIDEKRDGSEKVTSTAKRVDKLKISFDIDENRISQSGKKDIYICITAPDGNPIISGKFNTYEGEEKTYTQKMDIMYIQGQRQSVSFEWKKGTPFQPGEYKIEIYNNGFKIGEGVKPLKKGGLFS